MSEGTLEGLAPERLAQRVVELESQIAFQEEMHRRLDDVVSRQDREIVQLQRQLKALARQVAELGAAARDAAGVTDSDAADEVPPHY